MANKADALQVYGCVVKGKLGSIQEECSACGVLVSPHQGIILSHGSILTELCLKDTLFLLKVKNGNLIRGSDLKGSEFEALVDSRWAPYFLAASVSPSTRKSSYSLLEPEQHSAASVSFTAIKCKLLFAFQNEDFCKAVARIMPDSSWTFTAGPPEESDTECSFNQPQQQMTNIDEGNICFNLLSYFLILKIEPVNSQNNNILSVLKLPLLRMHNCHIGDIAEIIATPFGSQNPAVFFNTYSQGVVCNVNGAKDCWILTDARCIPGSEGGPLFTGKESQSRRYLTGIVAASLCWKNKEWVGFSLACSLHSIYSALKCHIKKERLKLNFDEWIENRFLSDPSTKSFRMGYAMIDRKSPLLSSTVLVKVGSTWGSGVIFDKEQGLLLTCSHVIKDSCSFDILIKPFQGSPQYKATLIYRNSGSLQRPYDIAVLKCPEATASFQVHEVPKVCIPKIGEKVYAVGHALFNTELDLQPSMCAGVISKIITFKDQPVMIQTTCAVHPGASGGPLLNSQGDVVGIVVCNTVDKGSNSSYPHINMSIPAISIWPAVYCYLLTGDSSGFSAFEIVDPRVTRLWALDNSVLDGAEHFGRSKL